MANKKVIWGFQPFDYRASEQYLERMAERGWRLHSVSGYLAEFSPAEPRRVVYRADVFGGEFEDKGEKKRAAYLERWEKYGWEFCTNADYLYYFCREGTDKTPPPGVRPQEEKQLQSSAWRRELYAVLFMILILAFGLINQTRITYSSLLTYTDFCKTSLFVVFVVPCCLVILYQAFVYFRGRACVKRGRLLPETRLFAARTRSILIYLPTMLFILYVLTSFVLDALNGYPRVLMMLTPLVIAAVVAWIVKKLRPRLKKGSKVIGVIIIMTICVIIAFLGYVGMDDREGELPEGAYALHLSDVDEDLELKYTQYTYSRSPVVSRHYIYVETATDGTTASTEYMACTGDRAADLLYSLVLDALENGDVTDYDLVREENTIIYTTPSVE